MRFVPPDYFIVFIVLQSVTHYLTPLVRIIPLPYVYLGTILILFGFYLNFIWVTKVFRKEKTTVRPEKTPSQLVTYGLFKYSRNPTYFGMALSLFGFAILLGSAVGFIFPILFIILTTIFTIPVEERNLEKKFGKDYINYKKKVRRWI